MRTRSVRIATAVACFLPALEIGPVTVLAGGTRTSAPVLASFIPSCEVRHPRIVFTSAVTTLPEPRRRDALVEVFYAGRAPTRRYVVLGEVEVRGRSDRMNFNLLVDHARREARRCGGEALVDVRPAVQTDEPRAPMTVTAKVVTWN